MRWAAFQHHLPGLVLIAVIVLVAEALVGLGVGQRFGLSPLIFAILLGMVVGNTVSQSIRTSTAAGINISKSKLLRLGIILYGFNLTVAKVWALGLQSLVVDALMLSSTFCLTYWFGRRVLKLDRDTCALTGAGCSVCGAAAVMATSSLAQAKPAAVTQAITVVVLFGTLAIFIYPLIYTVLDGTLNDAAFGVYVGATVHEVAQVVAIGKQLGDGVADTAILAKMVRVVMLAPLLIILSLTLFRPSRTQEAKYPTSTAPRIVLPWFALWFLVMIVVNSILPLPTELIDGILWFDHLLLMMAMAALGLDTQLATLKAAGPKAFILGVMVFIWLIVAGLVLQLLLR